MRFSRLAPLSLVALVALAPLASCSDDAAVSSASSSPTDVSSPSTGGTGDTSGTDTTTAGSGSTAPAPDAPVKPEVDIPDTIPTELVITDLIEGTGPEAAEGDTVVVHYVGVRSADGAEFDNSYDRGEPFPVTLGEGGVIPGWEQGLIGAQQGMRRQLDIPADLAYGDSPRGEVIQAGDALTFVIDVLAVLPLTDPADEPDITVEAAENVTELVVTDLVEGGGPEIVPGQTAVMHLLAYRADTGEQIASSWESGALQPVPFIEGQTLPGLLEGMEGLQAGTRRQMQIPFADAFGAEGDSEFGLPPETDLVLVIDVFSIY